MVNHFTTLDNIVLENDISSERIHSLDEVGATPDLDFNGYSRQKRHGSKKDQVEIELIDWCYHHRVTNE